MISLINDIIAIKLKLNTVCITELIILILASTFSVDTPNKLPAFPAVAPDIKSPTPSTTSSVNPVAAPAPIFVSTAGIFLPKNFNISSLNFNNFPNILSAQPTNFLANPLALGNFLTAYSPIFCNASLPNLTNLPTNPPSSATLPIILASLLLDAASVAPFINLVSATLATLPVDSLAALAAAKSTTLFVDLLTVFLVLLPNTNSFTEFNLVFVLLTTGCKTF